MKNLLLIISILFAINFHIDAQNKTSVSLDSLIQEKTYVKKSRGKVYEYQQLRDENGKYVSVKSLITDPALYLDKLTQDTIPLSMQLEQIQNERSMLIEQKKMLNKQEHKLLRKLNRQRKRISNLKKYYKL